MKTIEFKSKNYNQVCDSNKKDTSIWCLLILGLIIGFINGFWGGGGGMICVPTLSNLLKLEEKKAHATTILIMLPLSIASVIVYLLNNTVNLDSSIYITSGFVVGGVIGAYILSKINNVVLQIIFSVVIIAGGVKLLF